MQILALETTEAIGSVAAWNDRNLLLQLDLDASLRSAQALAPGLKNLLARVGWRPADVKLVAVTTGPGSFTGLRVGVATAKVFAYAVWAEVLGVDTLSAIANGMPAELEAVACAIDAQRGDVVTNIFRRAPDGWFIPDGENLLLDAEQWLASLPQGMPVAGPVLAKLAKRSLAISNAVDPQFWPPKAAIVAKIAEHDYAAGRRDSLFDLLPHYSRRSAAEEKQAAKP